LIGGCSAYQKVSSECVEGRNAYLAAALYTGLSSTDSIGSSPPVEIVQSTQRLAI
jgi:hypothetical protein